MWEEPGPSSYDMSLQIVVSYLEVVRSIVSFMIFSGLSEKSISR